jgi:serine/threonine-protein phosphatase PGAM5
MKYIHRSTLKENPHDENYSTLLVCHGNIIRYFVMRALQLPPDAWLRTAVWNASITIIEVHPTGRVSLRCMGDVGHIPGKQISYM